MIIPMMPGPPIVPEPPFFPYFHPFPVYDVIISCLICMLGPLGKLIDASLLLLVHSSHVFEILAHDWLPGQSVPCTT